MENLFYVGLALASLAVFAGIYLSFRDYRRLKTIEDEARFIIEISRPNGVTRSWVVVANDPKNLEIFLDEAEPVELEDDVVIRQAPYVHEPRFAFAGGK